MIIPDEGKSPMTIPDESYSKNASCLL